MIALGRSQAQMEKALERETKVYEHLSEAIKNGEIKKSESQNTIEEKYGMPVVIIEEEVYQRWVYKPGYGDFFKGPKISLFFDNSKRLTKIEILPEDVGR